MTYSIFSSKGFRDQAKFIFMMGPEQTGMGQLLFYKGEAWNKIFFSIEVISAVKK